MKNLDPANYVIAYAGFNVTGFVKGTYLEVEYDEDTFTKETGADGFVTRMRSRNGGGKVTFTLAQASPTNALLSALWVADRKFGTGAKPFGAKDLNGPSYYKAMEAWVMKPAKGEHADTPTSRVWILDCADLDIFIGGSLT